MFHSGPQAVGLALFLCHRVCQVPGVPPARLSPVHQPSVGTSQPANCPLARAKASSRSQVGPLSSNASWKKSTLSKQPAACMLPAENARLLCKNKGNRRALHGPARLPLPQKNTQFLPCFSCPLTRSFFKITFFAHTQRQICSLPFFLK